VGTADRLHTLDQQLQVVMDRVILEKNINKFEVLLGVSVYCNLKWFKFEVIFEQIPGGWVAGW
jgi:hypothetical protein